MNYNQWIEKVAEVCYEKVGLPWLVVCVDSKEPKRAFRSGQDPKKFAVEYLRSHEPCTASEIFY